jgi:hypothetical protein
MRNILAVLGMIALGYVLLMLLILVVSSLPAIL